MCVNFVQEGMSIKGLQAGSGASGRGMSTDAEDKLTRG